ncbi:MAG: hypothetical protein A3K19_08290 [Lentisphaerae bacterium RIFOXYB12_FULL_65_16]|nr:MAG: hypothetical protein A3K18_00290 [Lentisphaerae bacterium RIFOXYA12_64_32]OGV89868.1 MAG: hypothetical protein A3K19_08290 [Lentisphaerae bacterium RIFOXYB12_FULL_65_16]
MPTYLGRCFRTALLLTACAGTLSAKDPTMTGKVEVFPGVREGEVCIRAPFSKEYDLVNVVGKGRNGQFNFSGASLVPVSADSDAQGMAKAVSFHPNGDDSTPWNINGMYIGANHGCSANREFTCPGHGLGVADLGREWTDGAGVKWYLVKIVDKDKLWFLSQDNGKGDIWKFTSTLTGKALTGAKKGRTLQVQSDVMAQLYPAVRIRQQQWLVDGKTPVPRNGKVKCEFLDFVEENEVINPGALLKDIVAHAGQERDFAADALPATVRNTIVYRFHPDGAIVLDYHAKALQDFQIGYMGFVQSAPLRKGNYGVHKYYVPKTVPFALDGANYDFRGMQDYSKPLPKPLYFGAAEKNVESADNLPERFIQLLGDEADGRTQWKVGYSLGYSLVQGITTPEARAKHTGRALFLYTSNKTYPSALDAKLAPVIKAGTEFHCVAYRRYFNPEPLENATCAYWYRDGDRLVVYLDYHKSVDKDTVVLPPECRGKRITVVEKTPSLTLHTDKTVPADGVTVSVTGDYGYLVFTTPCAGK